MNLFQTIVTAMKLWQKYGTLIETGDTILTQISALEDGELFAKVEAICKANGLDIAEILALLGAVPDLTSIKGIQNALNELGAVPSLKVDGLLGDQTILAIREFQSRAINGLTVDGIPGPSTVEAIAAALAKM